MENHQKKTYCYKCDLFIIVIGLILALILYIRKVEPLLYIPAVALIIGGGLRYGLNKLRERIMKIRGINNHDSV